MAGIKVTREGPATPLPTLLEVSGDVDGDNIDWDTGSGVGPGGGGSGSDDDCEPVPHGSMSSTETLDPADGIVHTGTLTADLTVTLTAPECDAFVMEFHATQDGTGGWDITWPGSVTVNGTPDTTAGTTTVWLLDTVNGGTTWIAFIAGGGASSSGRWELAVIPGSPPDPLYADGDFLYIFVP